MDTLLSKTGHTYVSTLRGAQGHVFVSTPTEAHGHGYDFELCACLHGCVHARACECVCVCVCVLHNYSHFCFNLC